MERALFKGSTQKNMKNPRVLRAERGNYKIGLYAARKNE